MTFFTHDLSFFLRCTLSTLYIPPEATENDHITGELFNLCTVLLNSDYLKFIPCLYIHLK